MAGWLAGMICWQAGWIGSLCWLPLPDKLSVLSKFAGYDR
jgi:hypothetical protein